MILGSFGVSVEYSPASIVSKVLHLSIWKQTTNVAYQLHCYALLPGMIRGPFWPSMRSLSLLWSLGDRSQILTYWGSAWHTNWGGRTFYRCCTLPKFRWPGRFKVCKNIPLEIYLDFCVIYIAKEPRGTLYVHRETLGLEPSTGATDACMGQPEAVIFLSVPSFICAI